MWIDSSACRLARGGYGSWSALAASDSLAALAFGGEGDGADHEGVVAVERQCRVLAVHPESSKKRGHQLEGAGGEGVHLGSCGHVSGQPEVRDPQSGLQESVYRSPGVIGQPVAQPRKSPHRHAGAQQSRLHEPAGVRADPQRERHRAVRPGRAEPNTVEHHGRAPWFRDLRDHFCHRRRTPFRPTTAAILPTT